MRVTSRSTGTSFYLTFTGNVVDPDVYSGTGSKFSLPDPGSKRNRFQVPDPQQRMLITDLGSQILISSNQDPESMGKKDTGSWIRINNIVHCCVKNEKCSYERVLKFEFKTITRLGEPSRQNSCTQLSVSNIFVIVKIHKFIT